MGLYQLIVVWALFVFLVVSGIALGENLGVGLSERHGPKAACEKLRFQVYDCSKFKGKSEP